MKNGQITRIVLLLQPRNVIMIHRNFANEKIVAHMTIIATIHTHTHTA